MSSDRVQLEKKVEDPEWMSGHKKAFQISVLAHLAIEGHPDGRVVLQNHSGGGEGSPSLQVIDVPLFAAVEIYHLLGDALRCFATGRDGRSRRR